jgi:hypothetical protein
MACLLPDRFEPNDAWASARSLEIDPDPTKAALAVFTGTISPSTDLDWFRIVNRTPDVPWQIQALRITGAQMDVAEVDDDHHRDNVVCTLIEPGDTIRIHGPVSAWTLVVRPRCS